MKYKKTLMQETAVANRLRLGLPYYFVMLFRGAERSSGRFVCVYVLASLRPESHGLLVRVVHRAQCMRYTDMRP